MKACGDALEFFRARLDRLGVKNDGGFLYAAAFMLESDGVAGRASVMTDCNAQWLTDQWGQILINNLSGTLIEMAAADRVTHEGVETAQ